MSCDAAQVLRHALCVLVPGLIIVGDDVDGAISKWRVEFRSPFAIAAAARGGRDKAELCEPIGILLAFNDVDWISRISREQFGQPIGKPRTFRGSLLPRRSGPVLLPEFLSSGALHPQIGGSVRVSIDVGDDNRIPARAVLAVAGLPLGQPKALADIVFALDRIIARERVHDIARRVLVTQLDRQRSIFGPVSGSGSQDLVARN